MGKSKIESLLEAAKSSPDNDTSINVARRTFVNEDDARQFFRTTRGAMVRIEEWKKNSSITDYELFDEFGRQVSPEPISIGRFIRIALYGSGKYDWVRVEDIVDEPAEFVIVVRPSHDPTQPEKNDSISHFFQPQARNNFCLQLNEKNVGFYIIGINEKQNTEFTDGLIETVRNAAVANVGYYSGLQKAVWKQFCKNFLSTEEEKAD